MQTPQNTGPQERLQVPFDLNYEPARDVNPLELIGNASLALHHHMAPADGAFDIDTDETAAS